MTKTKSNALYIIVLLSALIIMFIINSGIFRPQNMISNWDNDLEEWIESDPNDFAEINAINSRMKIEYNWRDTSDGGDWFSVVKIFQTPQDFTPYYGISFWCEGYNSDTRYRVMLREQEGEYWTTGNSDAELFLLNSKERQLVIIPFSQFKHDVFTPVVDGFLDLSKIIEIGFIFWDGTIQKGVIYFDELQLIYFQWWRQNLPIISIIVCIDIIVAVLCITYIFNIKEARRKFQNILKKFERS